MRGYAGRLGRRASASARACGLPPAWSLPRQTDQARHAIDRAAVFSAGLVFGWLADDEQAAEQAAADFAAGAPADCDWSRRWPSRAATLRRSARRRRDGRDDRCVRSSSAMRGGRTVSRNGSGRRRRPGRLPAARRRSGSSSRASTKHGVHAAVCVGVDRRDRRALANSSAVCPRRWLFFVRNSLGDLLRHFVGRALAGEGTTAGRRPALGR